MKKLLLVFAALGLMANFSACTANQAENDAEFVENADIDKIEAQEPSLDDGSMDASSDNLALDNSLEAALNGEQQQAEKTEEATPTPTDPPPTAITDAPPAETTQPPADSLVSNDLPPTDDLKLDDPTALSAAPSETPSEAPQDPPATAMNDTPASSTFDSAPVAPVEETKPAPSKSSLRKVADVVPYAFGDGYVNTIYIARPKEKLKDISQTIYGSDKTKELKKINSFLKSRAPIAGDKIAYVSPNRPTDSEKTITYYEDTGMIPETYVAQKGDNLRKISKKLLGYDNAWKEVWSTNPLESKIKLAEGDTFKYWKSAATITPETTAKKEMPKSTEEAVNNIVQNNTAPEPIDPVMPPPPQAELPPPPQAELPPPPGDAMAANTTPADPSLDAAVPPPPPPDDAQFASPPPPPPEKIDKAPANEEGDEIAEGGEDDTMTMLGIGVLLFGALAFVLVKRKKARANSDMSLGDLGT